jgi:hypothetical protein
MWGRGGKNFKGYHSSILQNEAAGLCDVDASVFSLLAVCIRTKKSFLLFLVFQSFLFGF